MAFADFLDLRTAVLEHVGRTDIADVMVRLTQIAEARFNRDFRHRDQIASATVTFTSGTGPLPADFLEAIGLYDANGAEYVQQPMQSQRPTGSRGYFTIKGSNIELRGYSGDLTLDYYEQVDTITGSSTGTNWLLTKYPEVYLYGVGFEAAKYLKDVELAAQTKALYDEARREADGNDHAARYSRARVRVQGVTP